MFKRPIATALSPNTQADDLALAESLLKPQNTLGLDSALNSQISLLEGHFKAKYGVKYANSFNSGRSALLAILSALAVPAQSQIAVAGFTCNAVINPILKANCQPLYIDIDDDLNLDPDDLDKKISPRCKAVIVQHTFGHPAQIKRIQEICLKNNIILIEDCAHAYNISIEGKLLGTFGHAAFFSFGRDKVVSSVFGGLAIANTDYLGQRLQSFWEKCSEPSEKWTNQQLNHPIYFEKLILPLYDFFGLGKRILSLALRFKILGRSVEALECRGQWLNDFPAKMPKKLAALANHQISKITAFENHRLELIKFYYQALAQELKISMPFIEARQNPFPYMRFPILVENRMQTLKELVSNQIYLEDGWGGKNIVPFQTDQEAMFYDKKMCPNAEDVAQRIINLPTHINISLSDAKKIVQKIIEIV